MSSNDVRWALCLGISKPDGIGWAFALALKQRGYEVIISCREPVARADGLKDAGMTVLPLDLADEADVLQFVKRVEQLTTGSLDVIFHNACAYTGWGKDVMQLTPAHLSRSYQVNVAGPLQIYQGLAPSLHKAAKSHGRAVVLNMGTMGTKGYLPGTGLYHSNKAAIELLVDNMRLELLDSGIEVFHIVLGLMEKNPDVKGRNRVVVDRMMRCCTTSEKGKKLWLGPMTFMGRYIFPIMPNGMFDKISVDTGNEIRQKPLDDVGP